MINFRYVGFVDTFSLVASLRAKLNLFTGEADLKTLLLRDVSEDGVAKAHPLWRKWPELTNRIKQVQRIDQMREFELGRVALELLRPGGVRAWNRETVDWLRFHVALVTNPLAYFYSGIEFDQHADRFCELGEHGRADEPGELRRDAAHSPRRRFPKEGVSRCRSRNDLKPRTISPFFF